MSDLIIIDSGYSSLKGYYKDKWYKIPTSIAFSTKTGLILDNDKIKEYEFEGESYIIGNSSISESSFSTSNFDFKLKFEPLIIKNFRDKLNISDEITPNIILSLALVDYDKKDQLRERCKSFVINGKTIKNNIVTIIPQGVGSYYDFVMNDNKGIHPSTAFLIDIGYNTINAIYFQDGSPDRSRSRGYPGHGISSIIKPFTNYLETKFATPFSEQESIKIFITNKFIYKGVIQDEVTDTIAKFKSQFIKNLFNSILVADKKLIDTSEAVIISGGGTYFVESNTKFPPHFKIISQPYEFSNLRGQLLLSNGKGDK